MTLSIAFVLFIITGYSGYFLFFTDSNSNILTNFSDNDVLANVMRLLLCLNVAISVPYGCFLPRLSLFAFFTLLFGTKLNHTFMHIGLTLMILPGAVLLAMVFNNLGVLVEVVGAISAFGLAFIIPPLLFLRLESSKLYSPSKVIHLIILIGGIITSIFSVTQTLLTAYTDIKFTL